MNGLTHVDDEGGAQMVDVSNKPMTSRIAMAEGRLLLKTSHMAAIGSLPKGDALVVAQIAGIQGGKRCADLIPLCHPIALSKLDVQIEMEGTAIMIRATAKTDAPTGVEMEAYTAVVVAGITLIDMLKGVDPDLVLTDVRLMHKSGGKTNFNRV